MVTFMAKGNLEHLTRRFAESLPAKVTLAAGDIEAFLSTPRDGARGELAFRGLHSLVGSSGTYGFFELCAAARAAEKLVRGSLESGAPPTFGTQALLRELVERMESLAAAAASGSVPVFDPEQGPGRDAT